MYPNTSAKSCYETLQFKQQRRRDYDDVNLDTDFIYSGWTVRIRSHAENDNDTSDLGEYQRNATDLTILRPDWRPYMNNRREYKWWLPGTSLADYRDMFRVTMKMGKHDAWVAARKAVYEDYSLATTSGHCFRAIVTVSLENVELGRDAMGGIYADDESDIIDVAIDMMHEAICDAQSNLVKLLARVDNG